MKPKKFFPLLLILFLSLLLCSCDDKGPPKNLKAIPDYSEKLQLVLFGKMSTGDFTRIEEFIKKSFEACKINLILFYDSRLDDSSQNKKFIDHYGKKKEITAIPMDFGAGNYGAGFPRDNMPFPIIQDGKCKYLWGKPHSGGSILNELINKKIIQKKDVIETPFQFDGGDFVIGKNCVFVTSSFFTRKANKKIKKEVLEEQLKKYLGVKCVVTLDVPTELEKYIAHSDMIVRPLPCGKIVISSPQEGSSEKDKKIHEKNLKKARNVYGKKNVVEIPSALRGINSYANAVVVRNKECCIVFVPQYLGGADETPDIVYAKPDFEAIRLYKEALKGCNPKCIVIGISSTDTYKHGGASHCRTGNLFKKPCK